MSNSEKTLPKLKQVTHIPFIELKDYLEETFSMDTQSFWDQLCDNHMFKGNDTTMTFYFGFAENIFEGSDRLSHLLNPKLLELLADKEEFNGQDCVDAFLKLSIDELVSLYKEVDAKKKEILDVSGNENDYDFHYLIGGLMEAIIMKLYDIKDYESINNHDYALYFTW